MAVTTYETEIWGDIYQIRADFAEAACVVEGPNGGRQVASFRHSPRRAMRDHLREVVQAGGDNPGEPDMEDEIEDALDRMTERD